MFNRLVIVCAMLLLGVGLAANAQAKDVDPEAKGIQAGGFVMHPGAKVSVGYNARGSQGSDDGLVDVGVHFRTRMADDKKYAWDNNVSFKWRQFWGLGDASPNGGPDVIVSSTADLMKENFFRIAPSVSYSYVNDPEDDNLRKDYENHRLKAGIGFYIQPSGGKIFSQRIGYKFNGQFYTEHSDVSHIVNTIDSVTRWNFFPNTSMSLSVDFRVLSYLEDSPRIVGGTAPDSANSTSLPVRIKYGLQGLLLARLSYSLGLGYAFEYYDNGMKEHMFIMNARVRYDFNDHNGIYLEYKKDFDNVIYGDYYKFHRVTLGYDACFAERFTLNLEAGFGAFDFRNFSQIERNDYLVTASVGMYYHFFPGLKLGLDYRLRYNTSDAENSSYVKNYITLGLAYEY
ncbi:MAG: outer membrane beta-barrel protein [Proteobacteria bacterium]|nr:outer membrane beta-barrel protein [Pseudomonadota bacterium]